MEPRRTKLMPDDVVEYPLWEDGALMDETKLRADLGLSDGLLSDIKTWAEEEFLDAEVSRNQHRRTGEELIRRLRAEAGPGFVFRLHRSPLSLRIGERFRQMFVYPFHRESPDEDWR